MYCTGDFIDDYAVDEIQRNDLSFIFLLETDLHTIFRLLLYPTVISHFQARRARNNDNREIVARMQKLCTQLKTSTTWDEQEERLEIPMNRGVVPTTWNTRS